MTTKEILQSLIQYYKYKTIDVPQNDDLHNLTRRLVDEQQLVLIPVLNYCKQVKRARKNLQEVPEPIRMIVQGGAGNGKSTTIRVLKLHAEKILREPGSHPHKPRVLVMAFTGKAAALVDGITIHSAFDFKFGTEHTPLSDQKLAKFRDLLSELHLIIIDEYSLLAVDLLYKIHKRLVEIFQCDDLFANKSIILVGDLLQLQPVKASYIFETPKSKHFQAFHKISPLWESFTPIVLTKNHRQKEERLWAESLNRISKGILTQDDEALLRSRVTTEEFLEHDAMHVMYKNKDVAVPNSTSLTSQSMVQLTPLR